MFETLLIILQVILVVGIGFLYYYMKSMAELNAKLMLETKKSQDTSHLQQEAYFREISNEDMSDLIDNWLGMLTDPEKSSKELDSKMKDMIRDVMKYGSERTVNLFSNYMQCNYQQKLEDIDVITWIACIISSLKFDFSGYKVDPMDLIKIKINDYNEQEKLFIESYKKLEIYTSD